MGFLSPARLGGICLAAALLLPASLLAHGAPPAGKEIFVLPHGDWVYVTNFGVLTEDSPLHYVCEEAFFGSDRFFVAPFAQTKWSTFTRRQIAKTSDGCDFEPVMDLPSAPTDVAMEQGTGLLSFALQDGDEARLWQSSDFGATFTELDVDLTGFRSTGLGYLSSSELILVGYDTGQENRGEAMLFLLELSSMELRPLEVDRELRFPNLLDARDGYFLWHGRRGDQTEIYWSSGENLEVGYFETLRWPTAGALRANGARAYLGGVDEEGRGVYSASLESPSVWEELLPGHRALCMATTDQGLLLCGHRNHDDHDLLHFDEENQALVLVDFRELKGYRDDCPSTSLVAQTCPAVWPETARALSIALEPNSSTPGDEHDDLPGLPGPAQNDENEPRNEERSCRQGNSLLFTLAMFLLFYPTAFRPSTRGEEEPLLDCNGED